MKPTGLGKKYIFLKQEWTTLKKKLQFCNKKNIKETTKKYRFFLCNITFASLSRALDKREYLVIIRDNFC